MKTTSSFRRGLSCPRATDQQGVVLAKTVADAKAGEWERYKTSDAFDGTAQHPWWMETASLKKT